MLTTVSTTEINARLTLTKCVECNQRISPQAPKCPHCQTVNPHGVSCMICEKKFSLIDTQKTVTGIVCLSCVAKVKLASYQCQLCKVVNKNVKDYCCSCGHPFKKICCGYCSLPLIEQLASTILRKTTFIENKQYKHKKYYKVSEPLLVHKECEQAIIAEQAVLEEMSIKPQSKPNSMKETILSMSGIFGSRRKYIVIE